MTQDTRELRTHSVSVHRETQDTRGSGHTRTQDIQCLSTQRDSGHTGLRTHGSQDTQGSEQVDAQSTLGAWITCRALAQDHREVSPSAEVAGGWGHASPEALGSVLLPPSASGRSRCPWLELSGSRLYSYSLGFSSVKYRDARASLHELG